MSKLLEEAIEQLRDLPAEEQDAAADALFAFISNEDRQYILRPEQVAEVRRIREGLKNHMTRIAAPSEVRATRAKSHA